MAAAAQQSQTNVENEEKQEDKAGKSDDTTGVSGDSELQGKKSKQVKPKYICKGGTQVCGQIIPPKGRDSVMCDLCEEWYHPECQGLSEDAFNALSAYKKDFNWFCMSCKPTFRSMLKLEERVESKIEATERKILGILSDAGLASDSNKQLEEKITSMEKAVTVRMKEQQEEIEKSLSAQKEVAMSMPKLHSELTKSTQ